MCRLRMQTVTDPGQRYSLPGEFLVGGTGVLDRGEADVITSGLHLTIQRTYSMEHAYPSWQLRSALITITAVPKAMKIIYNP